MERLRQSTSWRSIPRPTLLATIEQWGQRILYRIGSDIPTWQSSFSKERSKVFQHKSLPNRGGRLRLLRVLPGHQSDPIICKIFAANLGCSGYIAISYAWGTDDADREILINGLPFYVRPNLEELLRTLRCEDDIVVIWVDAICIDQHSLTERSQQVRVMGDIFRNAQSVSAWLSNPADGAVTDFSPIADLAKAVASDIYPIPRHTIEQGTSELKALQLNPYWKRAWVVQELVLARDITLISKHNTLSWRQLASVISYCSKESTMIIRAIEAVRLSHSELPFEELFFRFGNQKCSIPHDKFYSLYGMISDGADATTALPDYELCLSQVFIQQVERWYRSEPVLSPLNFVMTFLRYFPSFVDRGETCPHDGHHLVNVQLPYHGTIVRDCLTDCYSVYRDGDIYRYRDFSIDYQSEIQAHDLVYCLEPGTWMLVVQYDLKLAQQAPRILGFVDHIGLQSTCSVLPPSLRLLDTESSISICQETMSIRILMNVDVLVHLAIHMMTNGQPELFYRRTQFELT